MKKYEGHTPGPWAVAEDMGWEPTRTIQYELAIIDCGDGESLHLHEAPHGLPTDKRGQNKANAKLIADAPMLAEQNARMLAFIKESRRLAIEIEENHSKRARTALHEVTTKGASNLIAEIEGDK